MDMNKYQASVRVKGQLVQTAVFADSSIHARLILQYQFGMDSIVSYPTAINEVTAIKPLTPDQQRIKSMKDRVKQDQAVVKAERARQKIQSAHNTLNQLESHAMSKTFRALHKPNNPYSAWVGIGTYGSFNDALAAVLRKKKQGSIAVQIQDGAKMALYSS